jgi:hypothetical protein
MAWNGVLIWILYDLSGELASHSVGREERDVIENRDACDMPADHTWDA